MKMSTDPAGQRFEMSADAGPQLVRHATKLECVARSLAEIKGDLRVTHDRLSVLVSRLLGDICAPVEELGQANYGEGHVNSIFAEIDDIEGLIKQIVDAINLLEEL